MKMWRTGLLPLLLVVCGQQFHFQGDVVRFAEAENFVIRDECKKPVGETSRALTMPITIKMFDPAKEPDRKEGKE